MDTIDNWANGARLAMPGNRRTCRKLTQTRSLFDDGVAIVFAVLFGALLVAMATVYLRELIQTWWYWCQYLVPAAIVAVKIRTIRKELKTRRRIANGEIEATQIGEGLGSFVFVISSEEKRKREQEMLSWANDLFNKNKQN